LHSLRILDNNILLRSISVAHAYLLLFFHNVPILQVNGDVLLITQLLSLILTRGLSNSYRSYLAITFVISIPRSITEALSDPHWMAAMKAEMDALLKNKIGILLLCYRGRRLLVVNGYLQSNIRQMVLWIAIKLNL
ncbi:hypothetical protein GIB67_020342, partial [Kingdonia uniflora]